LDFKGSHIDTPVARAPKVWSTLIIQRRWSKVGIAFINRWTAWQQRMGQGWPAITLQRAKHRIGVDLVAGAGQETAGIVAAHVIAERCDGGGFSNIKVNSRRGSLKNRTPDT